MSCEETTEWHARGCAALILPQAAADAKFMPSLVEATFLPWDVHPRKAKEIMMLQRFVFAVRSLPASARVHASVPVPF